MNHAYTNCHSDRFGIVGTISLSQKAILQLFGMSAIIKGTQKNKRLEKERLAVKQARKAEIV